MDIQQFEDEFGTDEQCFEYLYAQRCADGFHCTRTEKCVERRKWYRLSGSKVKCSWCKHQYSLLVGSMFQGSRVPIHKWFRAIWLIATQENGAGGMWLQKELDLGSYPTALNMLHKVRGRMIQEKLQGTVFVDVLQRVTDEYAVISVEVEMVEKKIKKICMCKFDFSGYDISDFIERSVEQGSTIVTDSIWHMELSDMGYIVKDGNKTDIMLQPVGAVVSFLKKRGLLGTPQGYCCDTYLDEYFAECCFKFNNRNPKKRFYKLLQECCTFEPSDLIGC
jgi:hypothetical protein